MKIGKENYIESAHHLGRCKVVWDEKWPTTFHPLDENLPGDLAGTGRNPRIV
jgi:hypothetical protein